MELQAAIEGLRALKKPSSVLLTTDSQYVRKGITEWIRSWKWEIRRTKNFKPGGIRGNRVLEQIENVTPPPECCICVFHGDPNPHRCRDPWVVENWHNV